MKQKENLVTIDLGTIVKKVVPGVGFCIQFNIQA